MEYVSVSTNHQGSQGGGGSGYPSAESGQSGPASGERSPSAAEAISLRDWVIMMNQRKKDLLERYQDALETMENHNAKALVKTVATKILTRQTAKDYFRNNPFTSSLVSSEQFAFMIMIFKQWVPVLGHISFTHSLTHSLIIFADCCFGLFYSHHRHRHLHHHHAPPPPPSDRRRGARGRLRLCAWFPE